MSIGILLYKREWWGVLRENPNKERGWWSLVYAEIVIMFVILDIVPTCFTYRVVLF